LTGGRLIWFGATRWGGVGQVDGCWSGGTVVWSGGTVVWSGASSIYYYIYILLGVD
jgi:hypothetical protein